MIARIFNSILVMLLLVLSSSFNPVVAQIKVEIDEEVKVQDFTGDWVDGIVVDKKRREILVEYNGGRQDAFNRKQIRKLYEFEGLDFGRMWESANGNFKIEASLHGLKGEQVELIKPGLDIITVPLSKLSQKDVAYVEKFKKAMETDVKRGIRPAAIPTLPEIEQFEGSFGESYTFRSGTDNSKLKLSAIPRYLKEFKQAGLGYNLIRNDQQLVAVMPIGGPDQLVLMSFREKNPFKTGDRFQSQLYWASLKKKKVVDFVSITHEDYAIDYNPRYKLLLTYNRNEEFIDESDDPDHYTIWKLDPGADTATPLIRFAATGMDWAETLFGKVVNDRIVVVKTTDSTYEAFDIKEKKTAYVLNTESFFDAPVVITHDRKHLIVPEDGYVSIVDAATGKFVFSDVVDDRHVSGANVNDSGTKLAAVTERNIYVWDLTSQNPKPDIYPAPLMGSPFQSRLEWIDDNHLLGESHRSRILYRLSMSLAVWSYEMDIFQYYRNSDPNTNMVVDGKFFYVAQPDPFGGSIAVGAVDLPGPGVEESISNVDRDSLLIVKPGVGVALDVSEVSDPNTVKQWLTEKIEANGWIYDPNAELVMYAKMGSGEIQKVTYVEERTYKTSVVSFKPHFANLSIMKDDLIVWQSGTTTGPPDRVVLRDGRTVQSEVNRMSKPQLGYFEHVRIESEIIDPNYSRGFGKSILGLRGIRVESNQPPGRENDPLAAARKAAEDRRRAAENEGKPRDGDSNTPNAGG